MRISLTFVLALCVLPQMPSFAVELSTTNEGVYIGICSAPSGQYPFPSDEVLAWRPFLVSGVLLTLNYPDPEYFLKIDMHDLDGKQIPKTSEGLKIGSKFDGVKTYDDVGHRWHIGVIEAYGSYDVRDGLLLSGPVLAEPSKWFKMDKPGVYEMEIQFQMFRVIKATNGWSRQLIRFEPMKVKVQKP
jgi:hypothetical protein